MADLDRLRRLAACLRIAHHIPGRIRLKLDVRPGPDLAGAVGEIQAFHRALSGADGIRSISLNALAASCTIEYDPARIPPDAWPDLVRGHPSPGAEALLRLAATAGA